MTEKLTEIATGKLLEKFGAGDHKPGSGSASALQGMLSVYTPVHGNPLFRFMVTPPSGHGNPSSKVSA
jgi:hypothetical protein